MSDQVRVGDLADHRAPGRAGDAARASGQHQADRKNDVGENRKGRRPEQRNRGDKQVGHTLDPAGRQDKGLFPRQALGVMGYDDLGQVQRGSTVEANTKLMARLKKERSAMLAKKFQLR